MNYSDFISVKHKINSQFANDLSLDVEIFEYRSECKDTLTIVASRDFSYYHNLEINLHEPKYFSGVFSWKNSPQDGGLIEILDATQNALLINENFIEDFAQGVRFLNDDGISIVAAASSITVNFDTVFYYWRDNIKEGERIADWVKKL